MHDTLLLASIASCASTEASAPASNCLYADFSVTVISCTSLNPISNGLIAYSPNSLDFGTTATHTCLEGYFLEGTSTRTCIGDGSGVNGNWNGVAPVCSGESSIVAIHRM